MADKFNVAQTEVVVLQTDFIGRQKQAEQFHRRIFMVPERFSNKSSLSIHEALKHVWKGTVTKVMAQPSEFDTHTVTFCDVCKNITCSFEKPKTKPSSGWTCIKCRTNTPARWDTPNECSNRVCDAPETQWEQPLNTCYLERHNRHTQAASRSASAEKLNFL